MTKKENDAKKCANKMIAFEKHLGRNLRPDEVMLLALYESVNASEEGDEKEESSKDAEDGRRNGKDLFFKKVKVLEQSFRRDLRPDEGLLLTIFDSTEVDVADKDDKNLIFNKKITALEQRFGRELRPDEALLIALFNNAEVDKADDKKEDTPNAMPWKQAADMAITLALLDAILGKDLESKLKKASKLENEVTLTTCPLSSDTIKDLFKPMDECCCDKKEDKND